MHDFKTRMVPSIDSKWYNVFHELKQIEELLEKYRASIACSIVSSGVGEPQKYIEMLPDLQTHSVVSISKRTLEDTLASMQNVMDQVKNELIPDVPPTVESYDTEPVFSPINEVSSGLSTHSDILKTNLNVSETASNPKYQNYVLSLKAATANKSTIRPNQN
jgi:hypothetical protein